MGTDSFNFLYLSEIINLPVVSTREDRAIGQVVDLAAATGGVYPKITGLLTKRKGRREAIYIPWNTVKRTVPRELIAVDYEVSPTNGGVKASEHEILLKRTFLDKQIISTSGSKVVRVNDLQLLIDNSSKETTNLWLVHIDIGIKGLLRRMGWVRFLNAVFKWLVGRDIKDKFVSWKHVQPTATTNVYGSLHLKTDSSKLSEIHPADLADILEDLGIDERISLLESLEVPVAAATIQEMPLKLRLQIAETLEPEKMAPIIEAMQMDETVDLLDELSPEQRNTLLRLLSQEKVTGFNELSKLSMHRVGSIMNTDFLSAHNTLTAGEVLHIVREECKTVELLYYVYVVDSTECLKGVVTLRDLLSSDPTTKIAEIMQENVITVTVETNIKRVAQIFFKYNFEAIPVVDDENRIHGIVTLRDTLEAVFPEVREESKG